MEKIEIIQKSKSYGDGPATMDHKLVADNPVQPPHCTFPQWYTNEDKIYEAYQKNIKAVLE